MRRWHWLRVPRPSAVQGPWMHYLSMDGLQPNRTYYYRVGDAGAYGLSRTRSFRSAPDVRGDASTLSIVLSDMGEVSAAAPFARSFEEAQRKRLHSSTGPRRPCPGW